RGGGGDRVRGGQTVGTPDSVGFLSACCARSLALGCQLLHLAHGRGAGHPNHLNEVGGVLSRLFAGAQRTAESLGRGIALGSRGPSRRTRSRKRRPRSVGRVRCAVSQPGRTWRTEGRPRSSATVC